MSPSYRASFGCPVRRFRVPVQTSSWYHLHGVVFISCEVLRYVIGGTCGGWFLVLYAWPLWPSAVCTALDSRGSRSPCLSCYPNEVVPCLYNGITVQEHHIWIAWAVDVTRRDMKAWWQVRYGYVEVIVAKRRPLPVFDRHKELCGVVFWTHS